MYVDLLPAAAVWCAGFAVSALSVLAQVSHAVPGAQDKTHGPGSAITARKALPLDLKSGSFDRPGSRLVLRARGNGMFTFTWNKSGAPGESCVVSGFVDSLSGAGKPDAEPKCKILIEATVEGVVVTTRRTPCLSLCANGALDGLYTSIKSQSSLVGQPLNLKTLPNK